MTAARTTRGKLTLVTAVVLLAAGTATAVGQPTSSSGRHPATPNTCIRRNGGDWNACNVGNGGRGDLPYRTAPAATRRLLAGTPIRTPNDCIRVNRGDWNACNVGNNPRGDIPHR